MLKVVLAEVQPGVLSVMYMYGQFYPKCDIVLIGDVCGACGSGGSGSGCRIVVVFGGAGCCWKDCACVMLCCCVVCYMGGVVAVLSMLLASCSWVVG